MTIDKDFTGVASIRIGPSSWLLIDSSTRHRVITADWTEIPNVDDVIDVIKQLRETADLLERGAMSLKGQGPS